MKKRLYSIIKMKKLFALLLALVMMFSLVACVQSDTGSTQGTQGTQGSQEATKPSVETLPPTDPTEDISLRYGGTFYYSYSSLGDTYDPMKTSGNKSYCWSQNVYENIINRDPSGNICPDVCEFELSEDALPLKLWVRENALFHNGDKVDIYDVKASFERACTLVSRMKNHVVPYLVSAEITEDKYLTIKFSEYDPTTLYYFAAPQVWTIVLPKEICEKYGKDSIINVEDAIGTGPYKVNAASEPGVKFVLDKFQEYVPCEPGYEGMGAPRMGYFDHIEVQDWPDNQVQLMALINGTCHVMSYDPEIESSGMYAQVPGYRVYQGAQKSVFYLNFNCVNPNVPTYDKNLRKAIAAAIDYDQWNLYASGDKPYSNYVSPMIEGSAYYCDDYAAADYHGKANLELAKQYLAKSNYKGEEIKLWLVSGSLAFAVVEPMFKALGLNVTVTYMDGAAYDEAIEDPMNNDFSLLFASSAEGDYLPNTLAPHILDTYWGSGNDTYKKTIDKMATLVYGSKESVEAWDVVDKLMAEECPTVVFRHNGNYTVFAGVVWDAVGSWNYFFNCYFDPALKK